MTHDDTRQTRKQPWRLKLNFPMNEISTLLSADADVEEL